jgi:hypothetical protein
MLQPRYKTDMPKMLQLTYKEGNLEYNFKTVFLKLKIPKNKSLYNMHIFQQN